MAGETVSIQLGGRRGKPIRGYMIVDAIDADLADFNWCLNSGYAYRRKSGPRKNPKYLLAHIIVAERMLGRTLAEGEIVDHKNHTRTDNRRSNLRLTNKVGNGQNRRGLDPRNTSGYRGVSWNRRLGKFVAYVTVRGEYMHLGVFHDPAIAAASAEEARERLGFLKPSVAV